MSDTRRPLSKAVMPEVEAFPPQPKAKRPIWRSVADLIRRLLGLGRPSPSPADASAMERQRLEVEVAALAARVREEAALHLARNRAVALASHELRTPLGGILGMADLLGHTALTPEQASYVNTIAHSAAALLNLVDDMLDVGKMAAGHWRLRVRPVDLVAWIEEIVELLAPRAQAKGLELAAYVAATVPARVEVDPEQLARIVMNLAGNAIKFTERGGVTIELAAVAGATTTRLQIVVRDSGGGIAPADQARIFGEYEQAEGGYTAGLPGTGLGLSIARAIAGVMNADLTLDSTLGEGAQFTLALDVPVLTAASDGGRPLTGRRFLLVSSGMIELSVLMRRLFDLGAIIDCASTTEAANEAILSDAAFDAVLIDDRAEIDVAALVALCARQDRFSVALVTPAGRNRLDRLREGGLGAHLIKPIRTQTLRRILSRAVDGDSEPAMPLALEKREIASGEPARQLRVLLADDNEINTLLALSMIGRHGHHIETAENGDVAIERARAARAMNQPFDVILMDLHMPVVDGFVAIATIRAEEDPGRPPARIIALTADSTEATTERALKAGADLALTKPVQAARLAEVLVRFDREDSGSADRHSA